MPSASQAVFSAELPWKRFTISMILYLYSFATCVCICICIYLQLVFIIFVFQNCKCISTCLLSGAETRSGRERVVSMLGTLGVDAEQCILGVTFPPSCFFLKDLVNRMCFNKHLDCETFSLKLNLLARQIAFNPIYARI